MPAPRLRYASVLNKSGLYVLLFALLLGLASSTVFDCNEPDCNCNQPGGLINITNPIYTSIADHYFYTGGNCSSANPYNQRVDLSFSQITMIGYEAFTYNENLVELILGDTVQYIGEYAFLNTSISNLTIPESVTHIGNQAFADIGELRTWDISVTNWAEIDANAFANCGCPPTACCPSEFNPQIDNCIGCATTTVTTTVTTTATTTGTTTTTITTTATLTTTTTATEGSTVATTASPAPTTDEDKSNTSLYYGLGLGIPAAAIVIAIAVQQGYRRGWCQPPSRSSGGRAGSRALLAESF